VRFTEGNMFAHKHEGRWQIRRRPFIVEQRSPLDLMAKLRS